MSCNFWYLRSLWVRDLWPFLSVFSRLLWIITRCGRLRSYRHHRHPQVSLPHRLWYALALLPSVPLAASTWPSSFDVCVLMLMIGHGFPQFVASNQQS